VFLLVQPFADKASSGSAVLGCTHPLSPHASRQSRHALHVHPLRLVGRTRIVRTSGVPVHFTRGSSSSSGFHSASSASVASSLCGVLIFRGFVLVRRECVRVGPQGQPQSLRFGAARRRDTCVTKVTSQNHDPGNSANDACKETRPILCHPLTICRGGPIEGAARVSLQR